MLERTVVFIKAVWQFAKDSFAYQIVGSILTLAFISKSAATAYAAVLGMGLILAFELVKAIKLAKPATFDVPADIKRKIQDLEARLITMEYEKKQRGF